VSHQSRGAAFIKESRMELAHATNINKKSGNPAAEPAVRTLSRAAMHKIGVAFLVTCTCADRPLG
jgi:hypothetical protein